MALALHLEPLYMTPVEPWLCQGNITMLCVMKMQSLSNYKRFTARMPHQQRERIDKTHMHLFSDCPLALDCWLSLLPEKQRGIALF
jgi:hypothetical protein